MWCKEEILSNGKKLTETINEEHENVKYLPKRKLDGNIVAVSDLRESVLNADILIFVIPHQYVRQICDELKGNIKSSAFALTLIKVRTSNRHDGSSHSQSFSYTQGFDVDDTSKELRLVSNVIEQTLNVPCSCLMGGKIDVCTWFSSSVTTRLVSS
jgi:glycerol-3-phosphate dehydrogenase (NAD+)